MAKILKKIMIVCCSAVAVLCFCIGAVLGLNTNKIVEAKAATQANYVGIVDGYNWYLHNTDRRALVIEFDQTLNAGSGSISNFSDATQLTVTLNGKARNESNLLARSKAVVSSNANAIEFVFKGYETSGTKYTKDETITSPLANGTVLKIESGEINGYTIPALSFEFNDGVWAKVDEEPDGTQANYVGIVDGYNWYLHSTDRRALVIEFDKTLNTGSGSISNFSDATQLTVTLNGKARNESSLLARSKAVVSSNANAIEFVFKGYETSGTKYTKDETITSPLANGTVLKIESGEINGYTIPTLSFEFNDGVWAKVETTSETPEQPEVQTAQLLGLKNDGVLSAPHYGVYLEFDKPLRPTLDQYGTANTSGNLASQLTWNGVNIVPYSNVNLWVNYVCNDHNGDSPYLEILFANDSHANIEHGDILHIPEGTFFGEVKLCEVTLYYNATESKWQTAPISDIQTAQFVSTDGQWQAGYGNANQRALYLEFDRALAPTTTSLWGNENNYAASSSGNLMSKMTIGGEHVTFGAQIIVFVENFVHDGSKTLEILFVDNYFMGIENGDVLYIPAGTLFGDVSLAEVTLYYNATESKWQTEPISDIQTANFERVAGCVMDGSVWGMHSILYVKFDKALAPKTTSIQGDGNANNSGNLKDKMTIGGTAISMGSQINFYLNTFYSAEGANSTILEIMFVNTTASDYDEGTVLYIPDGTLFGDVKLSKVELTYNGATWIDETKLTRVEFVEIDANRNNNNVWGMNYVTILYFDKPLYAEKMSTALAEQVAGDLGANLTLNGVTATELGVAITFASLSQEGRYGLEIHIPVDNMLKFSEDVTQIVLEIKADTIFLNNILPGLKFYLNEESKWQKDEFTYVYVAPMEVEFTGVRFRYNNDNNTWQTEGEWYLSVFEFSDFLSKTEIKGNSLPLGDKITLNGVKTSELGFIFGISAYGTAMNVQYPKAALLSILDAPRVELALAEPVEYGDSIIKPFKLYLNKKAIKWELIDGTDTTAPELTYTGATEITTSAEKPFVIDVSAFDKEDNKSAAIYYVWSEGALDESGKLVKGTHTCTVVAVDKSGNESKLELTVNVGDKDTIDPVISVPDTISAVEGAIPKLTYKAADDMDGEILCEIVWSEGALDESGKLVAGTHTITLTATDLTGNTSTKTVTVNVVKVDVPVEGTEPDDSTTPDDSTDSSDTPTSSQPSSGGCFGSIDASFAILLLALVVGVSALRFIKRKNSENKE